MCQYSAVDGNATTWHHVHLGSLALSGAGLLMVEATAVEERGRITHGCLGLYSDANEAALSDVVRTVRAVSDVKLGIQISHAGRKASSQAPWDGGRALGADAGAWETVAPSMLRFTEGWHEPAELTPHEIEGLVAAFSGAAGRAARIGFEVVEMHAAHGYLLHQFLSPLANKRTDQFGGDLPNRMRFPLMVFEAMRAACPDHVAVGARISGSDWLPGGFDQDEAAAFAAKLRDRGCAYVDVTSGGLDPTARIVAEANYQVGFAAQVRAATGMPVRAVGLVTDPKQAEAIIADGSADMVALARAMLADPRWPWRAAHALGATLAWPQQYRRAGPAHWTSGAE
jgi:2,4-dienoyl-CoA reductase-like NADH-dependent reductase (Old Yellow Enzyme family)